MKRSGPRGQPDLAYRGRVLHALDTRSTFERRAFRLLRRRLVRRSPRGDGRPVIVLPGHTGDDALSADLLGVLNELGHDARGWGLGVNDNGPGLVDAVAELVLGFDEPVALIGISLGGVFAREVARRHPDRVWFVATLGSPVQAPFGRVPDRDQAPTGVDTLCVVARFDQYVTEADATIVDDPDVEVRRVVGGHCGLARNPLAIAAIATRLAGR